MQLVSTSDEPGEMEKAEFAAVAVTGPAPHPAIRAAAIQRSAEAILSPDFP